MTWQDFYTTNLSPVYQAKLQTKIGDACATSPGPPNAISSATKDPPASSLSATQNLFLQLEQTKQALLAILPDLPFGFQLLNKALSQPFHEGAEFSGLGHTQPINPELAQNNHFAQALPVFEQSSARCKHYSEYSPEPGHPVQIHFYPPSLIWMVISRRCQPNAGKLIVTRARVRQIRNQAFQTMQLQFGQDLSPFLEANEL